ncbi:hypothetical protein BD414DRAFT_540051 [Trametes punicea]|nr:hypothetical protein BD414DRAFT_540051 [Trametes punicea]
MGGNVAAGARLRALVNDHDPDHDLTTLFDLSAFRTVVMAEHNLSPSATSSSSHKRRYDAMGPEGNADRAVLQTAHRSSGHSPTPSSSSAEGSRERNKRARNDMSDSSYASEIDDLLLSSNDSVSPSSDSSQSSYHSAHSDLPAAASSTTLEDAEEDDMLVDPVLPEPLIPSTTVEPSSSFEDVPPLLMRQSPPPPPNAAAPRVPGPFAAVNDEFARFLERANAFDRAIAPLRISPAVRPASSSRGAGPLPPARSPTSSHLDSRIRHVHIQHEDRNATEPLQDRERENSLLQRFRSATWERANGSCLAFARYLICSNVFLSFRHIVHQAELCA